MVSVLVRRAKSLVFKPEKPTLFMLHGPWFFLEWVGLLDALLQRSGVQQHFLVWICFFKLHARLLGLRVVGLCFSEGVRSLSVSGGLLACLAGCLFACYKYQMLCLTLTVLTINAAVHMALLALSRAPACVGRASLRPGTAMGSG